MKKSKKGDNSNKNRPIRISALHFEIEENAVEMMEEHLQLFKPHAKDADEPLRQETTKRPTHSATEIDLHGLTLEEAEKVVEEVLGRKSAHRESRTFKIITGKGRHSSSGRGVLVKEIYLFVVQRYGPWIERIEESPDKVRLGGVALRGHFHVTIKGP